MKSKSIRTAVVTVTAATLLLAATACSSASSGGGGTPGSSAPSAVTLKFAYMGTTDQQAQWNQLFAQFEQSYPNIQVQAEAINVNDWGAFSDKLSTQIAGGDIPDVIQIATEGQMRFAASGLLEPLDSYISQDKSTIDEYYSDIDPKLLTFIQQHGSPDGQTYYLPGDFNTMVMWCNTDVVSQAGATLPAAGQGWTWDQFDQFAKTIHDNTSAYAFNAADNGYFTGVLPWVLTAGGNVMDSTWTQATFNSQPVIDAATFVQGLVSQGYSPAPGGTFDEFAMAAQDKLACYGGGRWPIIQTRTNNMVSKTQLVPWPSENGKQGSPIGWNSYPILKASQNKDAAWDFVKFMISKAGSSYFASLGGTIVPARQSVAQSQDFLGNSPVGTDELYKAVSYATPLPAPSQEANIAAAVQDGWAQIVSGNVSPSDGAAQVQAKMESILQ